MYKRFLLLGFLISFVPMYAHADITTGLTSWLKFDDGAGVTATDSSGSGNSATLSGGASWGTGKIGTNSVVVNGAGPYVALSAGAFGSYPTSGATPSYSFTFATWFKTSSTEATIFSQMISQFPTAPWGYVPALYLDTSGKMRSSAFWHNGATNQIVSTNSYNDGSWHHVVVTYSSGTEKLYIDGSLIGTQTFDEYGYNGSYYYSLGIGYSPGWPSATAGWQIYTGNFDDTRVYSRALTQSDVTELYSYTGVAGGGGGGGGAAGSLGGWGWSSNFGWVSFNSADSGAGGGPYSVDIDASGNLSGYAWSPNIGWISFNSSDVTANCSLSGANLNKTTGQVTGGAYAKAYGSNSVGCIELSGTNHTSSLAGGGVFYDIATGKFSGYAWGGDTASNSGIGWLQFDSSLGNGVVCLSGCGVAVASITATCIATTPTVNIASGSTVSFLAAGTSGTGPYTYNFAGGGYNASASFSSVYNSSASGPSVIVKDSTGAVSPSVSCPSVTVQTAPGASSVKIGKTVATATASGATTYTAKQRSPFAIVWNVTLASDYTCSPSISPDPNNIDWNTNWKALSLNEVLNGGTKTWSGDTATSLTAGTASNVISPGLYQFTVTCTSPTSATYTTSATLKVSLSSVNEI